MINSLVPEYAKKCHITAKPRNKQCTKGLKTRKLCCEICTPECALNHGLSAATSPFQNACLVCYHVGMRRSTMQLSPDISQRLHDLCKSPISCVYRNARIILLASDGMPVIDIARALGIAVRSVKSAMRGFGISGIDALASHGSAGRPSGLTPERRQAIIDLFIHHPSEFGIEKAYWTAVDVAVIACREGIVEKISPATVRRIVLVTLHQALTWNTFARLPQGYASRKRFVWDCHRKA